MAKKYEYLIVLQQNFGYGHGWEDVCRYADTKEGRKECGVDYRAYLKNQPEIPLRKIHRRVPIG